MLEPDVIFGGGYYVFNNIRESKDSDDYYDIYILVKGIMNSRMYELIQGHFGKSQESDHGIYLPRDDIVFKK